MLDMNEPGNIPLKYVLISSPFLDVTFEFWELNLDKDISRKWQQLSVNFDSHTPTVRSLCFQDVIQSYLHFTIFLSLMLTNPEVGFQIFPFPAE